MSGASLAVLAADPEQSAPVDHRQAIAIERTSPASAVGSSNPSKLGCKRQKSGRRKVQDCRLVPGQLETVDLEKPDRAQDCQVAVQNFRRLDTACSSESNADEQRLIRSNSELRKRVADLESLLILAAQRLYAPSGDFRCARNKKLDWLGKHLQSL